MRSSTRFLMSFGAASVIGFTLAAPTSAAAAGGSAGPAAVVVSTPWRVVYATRSGAPLLQDVAAVSTNNVWAVGDRGSGPFVVHWDGRQWHTSGIPHPAGFDAQSIQASSAGRVWVLGFLPNSNQAAAIEWNGSTWHVVRLPTDAGTTGMIFGPADMWLTGNTIFCNFSGSKCTTTVLHWNGKIWNRFTVHTMVADIEGTSDGDLWIVGTDNNHQVGNQQVGELVAFRWSGKSWQWVRMPHPEISTPPALTVDSRTNAWVSASRAKTDPQGQQPTLGVHWDGRRWTVLTAPDEAFASGPIATDGRGGAWFTPNARWNGRTWLEEVGLWLPAWANPFSFFSMARIPGTTIVLVTVTSPGGTLIGASQRLP